MRFLIYILIILILGSCNQGNDSDENILTQEFNILKYVKDPHKKDTTCIYEIERAKKDINNGKIVFSENFGFGNKEFRYFKELKELCKQNGLEYSYDLIGCVQYNNQTQGCYTAYMDIVIAEKFGEDFKIKLHQKADSLFLVRAKLENKIVQYWDCDERPRLPDETKRTNDYLTSISISKPDIKENKEEYGGWPFFDIGFIIEKDSSISDYYISNFVPQLEENEKYKDELFKIAIDYIEENYSVWVPGKIKDVLVRTDNNVRIFLEKEKNKHHITQK